MVAKKREHFLTVGFENDNGQQEAMVFRVNKDDLRLAAGHVGGSNRPRSEVPGRRSPHLRQGMIYHEMPFLLSISCDAPIVLTAAGQKPVIESRLPGLPSAN